MSNEKGNEKGNFLEAGINTALPQRGKMPPRPPTVQRPKERGTEEEQTSENANSQQRNNAIETTETPQIELSNFSGKLNTEDQQHNSEVSPAGIMTDDQVRMLAQILSGANATTQTEKKAKRQKIDLADLLIQTIANIKGSELIKEQFSKLANSQKTKINQGVFAPEALFTIYNSASAQLKLKGKKVGMGDLMAKALIAYVPEIIRELEQPEEEGI